MTNPTELLPCGHCDSTNVSMSFSATMECADPAARFVECEECAACGPPCDIIDGDDEDAKARAAAAWNTRAAPASVASGEVERVAKAIDPEAWGDDLPVPTRSHIESFHQRRQASIEAARRALSLTTPARALSREEVARAVDSALAGYVRACKTKHHDPAFSEVSAVIVPALLALIGGGE